MRELFRWTFATSLVAIVSASSLRGAGGYRGPYVASPVPLHGTTKQEWPVALVAQDGIEHLKIEWDLVDAIFIGGSTEWKESDEAIAVAKAARLLKKWVHVGRLNTPERYHIWKAHMDSFDGTGLSRYSHMRWRLKAVERHYAKLWDAKPIEPPEDTLPLWNSG